jgi:gluconolactonase
MTPEPSSASQTGDVATIDVRDPRMADLVSADAVLERLWTGAEWTEGPVWIPLDGTLVFSDIPNNRLLRWSEPGVTVVLSPSGFMNGHTLDREGRVIACEHGGRRISRIDPDGVIRNVVDRYQGKRLNSPNDVVVKSDGTIWFSDPPYGIVGDREGRRAESELEGCYVFRYDPHTDELEIAADFLEEPNGLAFSPDERILYVSDTSAALRPDGNHHVIAFDVVGGRRLENPRLFAVMEPGLADGFRVDVDGNLFCSAFDGIHVLSPEGETLGVVRVPEHVSNCEFGGHDGRDLFITASTSLYRVHTLTRSATPRTTGPSFPDNLTISDGDGSR